MNRRELLKCSAALGLSAAGSLKLPAAAAATFEPTGESTTHNPLTPLANASIALAFLISAWAVVIDFCGPWEVFERVNTPRAEVRRLHSLHGGGVTRSYHSERWIEDHAELH